MTITLQPFQKRFLRQALKPGVRTAALSMPRGNGKSWLAAYILTRAFTPGDPLHEPGKEYILLAGSLEQARIVFKFLREELEPRGGYRFLDASTRLGVRHLATNTKLRVMSSNPKTAFGIVGCPLLVADEPGAWEAVGGQIMHDAIETAHGKPGSPLKVVYIGTLAPARDGWWHDIVTRGTTGGTYVQRHQGNGDKWDSWREIMRVNPLAKVSLDFRAKLKEEREEAKNDSRLKARFLSYRLNVPTADESEMLLTVDDWEAMAKRGESDANGRPIVGVDLGGGRAWSAAVAVWESGRVEAFAVAPGVPDLPTQEKRDLVKSGVYQHLSHIGALHVADGLHVQPPSVLWQSIVERWGVPAMLVCDRFRLGELYDAVGNACQIEPRVTRWSEAAFDIRALRKASQGRAHERRADLQAAAGSFPGSVQSQER